MKSNKRLRIWSILFGLWIVRNSSFEKKKKSYWQKWRFFFENLVHEFLLHGFDINSRSVSYSIGDNLQSGWISLSQTWNIELWPLVEFTRLDDFCWTCSLHVDECFHENLLFLDLIIDFRFIFAFIHEKSWHFYKHWLDTERRKTTKRKNTKSPFYKSLSLAARIGNVFSFVELIQIQS